MVAKFSTFNIGSNPGATSQVVGLDPSNTSENFRFTLQVLFGAAAYSTITPAAVGSNTAGNNLKVMAGSGSGTGHGGSLQFYAGTGGTTSGNGGVSYFKGGNAGSGSHSNGGKAYLRGGNGDSAGYGGYVYIQAGDSGTGLYGGRIYASAGGRGSGVYLLAQSGGPGLPGGSIGLIASSASTGSNQSGGDVFMKAGFKDGSGARQGLIIMGGAGSPSMPTSDPHVIGALWNSSGALHISGG